MSLIVVIIILALVFDYINGFHDAANSIATVVSTKVLSPFQAVAWAAMFNFVAFFIFKDHAVANTISKTVHAQFITLPVILSGLVAAIIWNLLTWWYGIPSSSSHTLIGGFAGAALTHAFSTQTGLSFADVVESGMILKIVAFIFLAPLLGMALSMFVSLVTLVENTWFRVSLIILTSIFTWFLFLHLQEGKMEDNIASVMQVDVLHTQAQLDPSTTALYEQAQLKLDEATPLLALYPKIGASGVAKRIIHDVDPTLDEAKLTKAI